MIFIDPRSISRLILQDPKDVKTSEESSSNTGPAKKPVQDEVLISPENKDAKTETVTKETEDGKETEKLVNGKITSREIYDKNGKLTRKQDFQYTVENGKEKETITTLAFDGRYYPKSIVTLIEGKHQSSKFYDEHNKLSLEEEIIYIGENEKKVGTKYYRDGKPTRIEVERFVDNKAVSRTGHSHILDQDFEESVSYESDGENEIQNITGIRGKGTNDEVHYIKKLVNNRTVSFEEFDKDKNPVFKSESRYEEDENRNKIEYSKDTSFFDGAVLRVTSSKTVNGNIVSSETFSSDGDLVYSETFTNTASGDIETITRYSSDGKKEYVENKQSNSFVYYDENNTPYLKELKDENSESKSKILLDLNGEPLDFNQDAETLKKNINSLKRYFAFADLYSQDRIKISIDTLVEIRLHGEELCPEITSKVRELEKKYGVEINPFYLVPYGYKGSLLKRDKVSEALNDLDKEMQKYPPGFFKNRELIINLMGELTTDNEKRGSASVDGLHIEKRIYLTNVKNAFDHELYHFLEFHSGGYEANNPTWVKEYGSNYPGDKGYKWHDELKDKPTLSPGFDASYTMVNPEEHQATIAERLFKSEKDNYIASLKDHAEHREIMQKHRKQLIEEYKKWSGGLMNEQYFDDIMNEKINDWEAYWKTRTLVAKQCKK